MDTFSLPEVIDRAQNRRNKEYRQNELPAQFRSWLAFYDHLPADVRDEPVVQALEVFSPDNYTLVFGKRTYLETEIIWRIDRDYYLARVAELLLPARLSYNEYNAARMELMQSPGIAGAPNSSCIKALGHVASVARRS